MTGPTGSGKGTPGEDRPETRKPSDLPDSQGKEGEHKVSLGDIMDPKAAAQAAEKLHKEELAQTEKQEASKTETSGSGSSAGTTSVPKFFTTDFSPKAAGTLGLGKDLINQGLTKELGKELSRDGLNVEAIKEPTVLDSAANRGLFMPLGLRQHFQLRKGETAPAVPERPLGELKNLVDDFLKKTSTHENDRLTPAERQELSQTRQNLKDATTVDDAASNALHLARLYQHLRYIEEAQKATELSLGLDPEHMQGREVFKEMERTHPVDVGARPINTTAHGLSKSILRDRINSLSLGRVVVVGDLLIDELLEGKPERISREAPVLILEHVDTELIPGGAANTAHNITALGGACHAVGVCGKDEYAQKLAQVLEKCGVKHSLVPDGARPTTVKTRILSKSHSLMQQLLRLDRISHETIPDVIESILIDKIDQVASDYDAIVLSDYKGGVITDGVIRAVRKMAKRRDMITIVDAQGNFERFQDFTLMTPNQPDTEKAVGYQLDSPEKLRRAGEELLLLTGLQALLITRGPHGMALFQKGEECSELPVFNKSDVFDVTGAGDTVVATMALALVTGASFVEAMALGNLAAGIVVRKSGTAVTSQAEMLENLERLNLPD